MGEFFKGWRRKAGVMTLVMACGFTGAWVRSQTFVDQLWFVPGERNSYHLASILNRIEWQSEYYSENAVDSWDHDELFVWSTTPLQYQEQVRYFLADGMQSAFCGFQFGYQHGSEIDSFFLLIPYWLVVGMLTLLSLYLLLRKPRTKSVCPTEQKSAS